VSGRQIDFGYDQLADAGGFLGWIDDVRVTANEELTVREPGFSGWNNRAQRQSPVEEHQFGAEPGTHGQQHGRAGRGAGLPGRQRLLQDVQHR